VGVQIDASRPLPLLLILLPAVHRVFLFLLLMTSTSSSCSSSSSGKVRDPCMVSVSGDCLLAFDCLQLRGFCGAGAVACLACASSSAFSSVAFLVVDMR
jgi:hypothetical protein